VDITILIMREHTRPAGDTTDRHWNPGDIVDVFRGIGKDPGQGATINPKHAVIVVRNIDIPSTNRAYRRLERFLTHENYETDEPGLPASNTLRNNRRHSLVFADLTPPQRNAINNNGRLVIEGDDFIDKVRRRTHGINPESRLAIADWTQ